MPYVFVVLVAAVAGCGAAYSVVRGRATGANPETWTKGYQEPALDADANEPLDASGRRRRPLPSAPTWQTRLTGVVGLLIAVLVGAGLIVGACLAVWTALRRAVGN
ncbi:MAG: hypothetical protein ABJB55_03290 [Actinomycetota bacterium]